MGYAVAHFKGIEVEALRRLFLLPGFESAGFDRCAISFLPADLAGYPKFRSRRWVADVEIAYAISKSGFSQASSAGQSGCRGAGENRRPIWLVVCEHGPGDAG
jgi:hypothetical protein